MDEQKRPDGDHFQSISVDPAVYEKRAVSLSPLSRDQLIFFNKYNFQAINRQSTGSSSLIKLMENNIEWESPFSSLITAIFASSSCNSVVVSLSDHSLLLLDFRTGVPCFPAIYIEGGISMIKIENSLLLCLSQLGKFSIWSLRQSSILSVIIYAPFNGPISNVESIDFTFELESSRLSPVIVTSERKIRFSPSRESWILCDAFIPPVFETASSYETIMDLQREFARVLLYHEAPKAIASFSTLLRAILSIDLEEVKKDLTIELIGASRRDSICGVNYTEFINEALRIISAECPSMISEVSASVESELSNLEESSSSDFTFSEFSDSEESVIPSAISMSSSAASQEQEKSPSNATLRVAGDHFS